MSADGTKKVPMWHHFVVGGFGDMAATLVSHPADVLKVRMQLLGERDASRPAVKLGDYKECAQRLVTREGVRKGLYGGLSAALLRHSIFSTLRHGMYRVFEEKWATSMGPVTFSSRLGLAVAAGAIAGSIANPCDIALIRMQADGAAEPAQRRGYKNVMDAITRIAREEGVRTLWRGAQPTVLRAVLITSSQITSFGTAKDFYEGRFGMQGVGLNMASAMTSATVACIVTQPVDVVKTRIMQMKGNSAYSGPVDVVVQAVRTEGVRAFYKGLTATFLRLWPHTVMLWMVQERVSTVLKSFP